MRARLPRFLGSNRISNHSRTCLKTGYSLIRPPCFHNRRSPVEGFAGIRHRFSLADRIKSFLPDDVFEDDSVYTEEHIEPQMSLAAYESEIFHAEKLVKSHSLAEATSYITNSLPLQVALTVLADRIAPIIRNGVLGELGVLELGFHLYQETHSGLAQQFLQAVGLERAGQLLEVISVLIQQEKAANSRRLDSKYLDALINEVLGSHFPQVLSKKITGNSTVDTWFKVHVLAMLPWSECEKWLNRYWETMGTALDGETSQMLALMGTTTPHFVNLSHWAMENSLTLVSLILITSTPEQLHGILRPLLRPSRASQVDEPTAVALLKKALQKKQSYDIANICGKFGPVMVDNETNRNYLADALLAVAFAQKNPSSLDDEEVTLATSFLQTPLVSMVLPQDRVFANSVIGWAAWKLHARYRRTRVSGRVLWRFLLSLPSDPPLNGYAQSELAKLVVQRPYIEQIRYMALPYVSQTGVAHLVQWHIKRIVDYRRRNQVSWNTLQAKEDVQLLVAGMSMAAEKVKQHHKESNSLDDVIRLFEVESQIDSTAVLEQISSDEQNISAWLLLNVTAELVAQKNFVVAQQMLRMLGPGRLSRVTFDSMLLQLTETNPSESYFFVLWLLGERPRSISYTTMNVILLVLIKERSLSESQLMNRFQTLRILIGNKMRREVSVEAARGFVNALIESSKSRNGGSRVRLKWALEIAHKAGVPATDFDQWTQELKKMNADKVGFWYNT